MAPQREWADAYLAQARADLAGACLVGAAEPSVFAMLMQMAFEYPWETTEGAIQWPARGLAIVERLSNPRSNLVVHGIDFAMKLSRNFDGIFP